MLKRCAKDEKEEDGLSLATFVQMMKLNNVIRRFYRNMRSSVGWTLKDISGCGNSLLIPYFTSMFEIILVTVGYLSSRTIVVRTYTFIGRCTNMKLILYTNTHIFVFVCNPDLCQHCDYFGFLDKRSNANTKPMNFNDVWGKV